MTAPLADILARLGEHCQRSDDPAVRALGRAFVRGELRLTSTAGRRLPHIVEAGRRRDATIRQLGERLQVSNREAAIDALLSSRKPGAHDDLVREILRLHGVFQPEGNGRPSRHTIRRALARQTTPFDAPKSGEGSASSNQ
jgi:hypothetical protein